MIVYQALFDDFKVYCQSYVDFVSGVDRKKYPQAEQKYHFQKIDSD